MSRGNNSAPDSPPRFVSWAAVSSLPQAEKISLSDQLAANRSHAEKWGGVVVEELVVPGESRSIVLFEDAARRMPAYARLRELIDARAFDVLVYLDRSRLGRKASLSMAVVELCAEAGIACYETSAPPSTLDAAQGAIDNQLVGAIKSVMAQDEVTKFVRRSQSGRRGRVLGGKHAGNLPYGYRRHFHPDGTITVEQDAQQAEAVRLFYALYLERGLSVRAIARELEARGYITRFGHRTWTDGSLRSLLHNRWTYAGYTGYGHVARRRRNGRASSPDEPGEGVTWAKAEWEPIITEQIALRAEAEMMRRRQGVRSVGSPHRYSGMLVCDYCGGSIVAHGDSARISTGRANGYACRKRCTGAWIREPVITDALRAVIRDLSDDANLEALMVGVPTRHDELQAQLERDSAALDAVRAQRKALTLTYTRGTITLDEYEALMAELGEQADTLARAVGALAHELASNAAPQDRRAQLEALRDQGEAHLDIEDAAAANRWLRPRFRIYVAANAVAAVEVLSPPGLVS